MNKLTTVFLLLGACSGGVISSPPDETSAPIIGGTTDTGDPSVVVLFAQTNGSQQGSLCTASVIAPTVLLTAAHCVAPSEVGSNVTFQAMLGNDFNGAGGQWLAVAETHFDPGFDAAHIESGHDVAVAILQQPVSLAPLPFNRSDPSLMASLTGGSVRMVGYGVNNGNAQTGAGIKRQVTTVLDDVSSLLLHIGTSARGTCQGDSGGPAFMNVGGVETIVGVTSYGIQGCTDGSYDTRIDLYSGFLDSYVHGGGGPTGTPPPTPASGCDANGGWESEPNDSAQAANTLCADGHIGGTIDPASDHDWLTWTVAPNQDYFVTLSTLPADYNMTLYKLVNGTLSAIATADDNHDQADQSVSRHTATGGTYYLDVFGVGGATNAQSGYTVTVKTQ